MKILKLISYVETLAAPGTRLLPYSVSSSPPSSYRRIDYIDELTTILYMKIQDTGTELGVSGGKLFKHEAGYYDISLGIYSLANSDYIQLATFNLYCPQYQMEYKYNLNQFNFKINDSTNVKIEPGNPNVGSAYPIRITVTTKNIFRARPLYGFGSSEQFSHLCSFQQHVISPPVGNWSGTNGGTEGTNLPLRYFEITSLAKIPS